MLNSMMVCYASGAQPSPQHVSTARHQSTRPANVVLSKPLCYTSRVGFVVQKQVNVLRILLHNFSGLTLTNSSSSRPANGALSRFRCCASGTQANPKQHVPTARHQSARPCKCGAVQISLLHFSSRLCIGCTSKLGTQPESVPKAQQMCCPDLLHVNACRLPRLRIANVQSRPAGTMICTAQTCYTSYACRLISTCRKLCLQATSVPQVLLRNAVQACCTRMRAVDG